MKLYRIIYTYRKINSKTLEEKTWSFTGESMVEVRKKLEGLTEIFLASGYELVRWRVSEIENTV